jgi:hypothetical protein
VADPSSLSTLLKWGGTAVKKAAPDRILRWRWPAQKVLSAITVFHFDQAPHFYVQTNREPPELQQVGFNVFNFSPFKLAIVGADLRITVDIDGRDWLTYDQRFSSEKPLEPYGVSGFIFARTLSEPQAQRLRNHADTWTRLRISGNMILRSTFGEIRKEIHRDVVALIGRDPPAPAHKE